MTVLPSNELVLDLADTGATETLGKHLSLFLKPGDIVTLDGDLGAGKTTLARAMIRAMAPDAGIFDVPSPTFTLVQLYDFTRLDVAHYDFYRLNDEAEALELGFPDLSDKQIALVEWPQRAPSLVPEEHLHIVLRDDPTKPGRQVTMIGSGSWASRLDRFEDVKKFLAEHGFGECERVFLQGDASARRYERLRAKPSVILMDSPAQCDGPPVRDGKPYSQIAHLAEDVSAFGGIAKGLQEAGLSAPHILASDYRLGMLIIEDFGDSVFATMLQDPNLDMNPPYKAAVDILCHLATHSPPADIHLATENIYHVPTYDTGALEIEAELLLDWFWPAVHGNEAPPQRRAEYLAIWRALWPVLETHNPVWVLRDFHSPNLLWLPNREGLKQVGVIDFQDAVLGHPAYDLASLLQDARVDVPPERESALLDYYCAKRLADDARFDAAEFRQAYGALAAQRNSKILGIFMRLKNRDGKPGYLKHIPRLSEYLERTLTAPHLADLRNWYETWLPAEKRTNEALLKGSGG